MFIYVKKKLRFKSVALVSSTKIHPVGSATATFSMFWILSPWAIELDTPAVDQLSSIRWNGCKYKTHLIVVVRPPSGRAPFFLNNWIDLLGKSLSKYCNLCLLFHAQLVFVNQPLQLIMCNICACFLIGIILNLAQCVQPLENDSLVTINSIIVEGKWAMEL